MSDKSHKCTRFDPTPAGKYLCECGREFITIAHLDVEAIGGLEVPLSRVPKHLLEAPE